MRNLGLHGRLRLGLDSNSPSGGGGRSLAPIDNKNGVPQGITAAGVEAGVNYALVITNWADKPIYNPRILAWNSWINTSWAVVNNANSVEWAAAWDTGSNRYALNFDGSATYTMASGDVYKESQSNVGVPKIDPGQSLILRIWNHLMPGTYVQGSGNLFAALGEGMSFTGIVGNPNKTLIGTITPSDGQRPPVMAVGDMEDGGKIALTWGHSLAQGQAETILASGYTHDGYGMQGVPQRILRRDGYNSFEFCRPSSLARDAALLPESHPCRQIAARSKFRRKIFETLRNDINADRTVAAMRADLETLIGFNASTFTTVIGETPVTGGDYTTVDGQTRAAGTQTTREATRVSLNAVTYANGFAGQTDSIDVRPAEATTSVGAGQPGIVVNIANGVYDGTHRKAIANTAIINAATVLA